jgi:DNA-directed RNA polymerase specialized sigma24 family protein
LCQIHKDKAVRQIIVSKTDSSGASFEKLLSALDADHEIGAKKYIEIQNRLMMKFEQRGCRDPYVLAVETLKRVEKALWNEVIIEKNIYAFIHAVGNNVLREYWKRPESRIHEVEISEGTESSDERERLSAWEPGEEHITLEMRIECLEKCLSELPPETRTLFLEYHDQGGRSKKDSRERLAASLGLNLNALRQRLHRIKKELQDSIAGCAQSRLRHR